MGKLAGKVALVVGAAGKDNMAQVIARRFAHEGAKVVVAGRHAQTLETFAEEINGAWVLCDITNKQAVDDMVAFAIEQHGRLDIGLNATGWALVKRFTKTTTEDLDQIMDLQFKGPFQLFQALIGAMEQGGSIIQISTATATIMVENHAAYMGTKAGIDHVIRCVANEYGAKGIRANSISPGITETPMTADAFKHGALIDAFRQCYPLDRVGTSADIAAAAVFLASDECFMTGQNLQVNGGLTLRRNPTVAEMKAGTAQ